MRSFEEVCSSTHLVIAAEAIAFATHVGLDPVKGRGWRSSTWNPRC